ncbi:Protein of unknown function [Gryllus bimaculatus]|nr:Protein of unknown function [Gryllus bimaculatus]
MAFWKVLSAAAACWAVLASAADFYAALPPSCDRTRRSPARRSWAFELAQHWIPQTSRLLNPGLLDEMFLELNNLQEYYRVMVSRNHKEIDVKRSSEDTVQKIN